MLTLIRAAKVDLPGTEDSRDILVAGERIAAVAEPGTISISGIAVEEIDAAGLHVLPGMVDSHVHLTGGGGEGGPATRVPEIRIEEIVGSGVTSVIGCLGTDGVTRHMTSLLAKARGLEDEGHHSFRVRRLVRGPGPDHHRQRALRSGTAAACGRSGGNRDLGSSFVAADL